MGEEKAFPWLFPTGIFGYTYSRKLKVSRYMYFCTSLFSVNPMWTKDLSYLFHAAKDFWHMTSGDKCLF